MKKLISLLLAVMLVMSMMTFSVMASTDTEITPNTAEESLSVGVLGNTRVAGFYTNKANGVEIAKESAESSNNIFKLKADYTGSATGSYLLAGYHSGIQDSQLTRLSAKISLPSVEGTSAITGVFLLERTYSVSPKEYTNAGVFLKNGGAYCYDRTLGAEQAFVPAGTMQANKWYRVEAIYDTRAMTADEATSKVYMNAFVYDGETNQLVGTSGWRFVSTDTQYSNQMSFRMPIIQAYKYSEGSYVLIDDYKIYKITDAPSYEYELKAEISQEALTNKYIAMEPTAAGNSYRSLAEYFNGGYPVIAADTEDKATRIEMDFRIPTLDTNANVYNFLMFNKSKPYAGNNNNPFVGTAYIDADGFKVRSYNGTKYADAVNLMAADSTYTATSYPIEENTWYKLVWDCDFTNYTSPTATLKLLDENGNILTQTQSYAAGPMPIVSSTNLTSLILYCGMSKNTGEIHVDNTNAYYAPTVADLASAETRKVQFEEDFEVYTEEDSANHANYTVGNLYEANIATLHVSNRVHSGACNHAYVRMDDLSQVEGGSDVTVLTNTAPVSVDFTYTKPIPASVLTNDNIEFYANGIKMSTGYTITTGEQDANGCVTDFTVATGSLDWGTDYIIRVKAGIVDYNTALSGGVPAEPGLYKDIAFSVIDLKPNCEVSANILGADELPYGSTTLTSGDAIKGCVAVTNNDDSELSCYGILAIYDGTKLVDAKKTELITIPSGETVDMDTEAYTATKDGLTAKLFVWNNFELMIPWIAPAYLGQ